MTEPSEKGGGLLANSAQQILRPVSRELLLLPIPFPDNEKAESERLRELSRAVKSRVNRRVGWQDWTSAGVRSMNEIFSRMSASEAESRPSAMQLNSLDQALSNATMPRKPSKCFAVQCLDTLGTVSIRPPRRRVSWPARPRR